jgi:predicted glutamine amidotransferase
MCLIILNPAGEKLPQSALDNGWSNNPDGAGYMFVANGKLIIRKPYYKLRALKADLMRDHAEHNASSPFVVHFRFATHGEKTAENCHPHAICGEQIGLAHNGVLHDFLPPFDADYSDTVHFCRTVLAYRAPNHVIDANFRSILAEMIGTGNKFVLLRDTREVSIVNESAGVWDNGNWYSNATYKTASVFGRFKRSTTASSYSLPAHYAKGSLFGDCSPCVGGEMETREEELCRLENELDAMDFEGWDTLTPDEQDHYAAMYARSSDLERELDARLR